MSASPNTAIPAARHTALGLTAQPFELSGIVSTMADQSQREDLFDQLRKLTQSGQCQRLSLEVDGCQMEFKVGEKPGQVTINDHEC